MLNRFLHRKYLVAIGVLGLACLLLFLSASATPQQVTSSVAIGTPGLTINSASGRVQTNAANNDLAGTITITASTSSAFHTFSGSGYSTAPPVCVATPIADPNVSTVPLWWVSSTTAAVTVHTHSVLGTGTSLTFNYVCIGNPN
jgi:hypothetical protein